MRPIDPHLKHGETYQNKRGDFRGPMDERTPGVFLDQYGNLFDRYGVEMGHVKASSSTIVLSTAGTMEGWRDESAYARNQKDDSHE